MVAKQGQPTLGLSFGCFVLQDIPVLPTVVIPVYIATGHGAERHEQ